MIDPTNPHRLFAPSSVCSATGVSSEGKSVPGYLWAVLGRVGSVISRRARSDTVAA